MKIHQIKARDLPDLWFQAVNDILDHGERFVIDRGSYAGQTRLEYDYFIGHVNYPATIPLIPDIPPGCGIPNPVEHDYIYGGPGYERAYIEYLMSDRKEEGESYTYGERLTKVPLTGDKLVWWQQGNAEIVDKREVDGTVDVTSPSGYESTSWPRCSHSQGFWFWLLVECRSRNHSPAGRVARNERRTTSRRSARATTAARSSTCPRNALN